MKKIANMVSVRDFIPRIPLILLFACCVGVVFDGARVSMADEEDKIPKPVDDETLTTGDGVSLAYTWYPSPKSEDDGKSVVPVIILHGWGGHRKEYDGLASYLQSQGHAVIVPDLRGHGNTKVFQGKRMNATKEGNFELGARRVPVPLVMNAVVKNDIEAVKGFLVERNNDKEINIELLCVVAVQEMCVAALNWAKQDWSWPQYANFKQGQDVKALVLISPMKAFKGATTNEPLKHPIVKDKLSAMIVVGEQDSRVYRDVKSLHTTMDRARPPLPEKKEDKLKVQDLFLIGVNTALQGVKLLDPRYDIEKKIGAFIKIRLVNGSGRFHILSKFLDENMEDMEEEVLEEMMRDPLPWRERRKL